jgi:uncharacterized protein (UPF0276 family)
MSRSAPLTLESTPDTGVPRPDAGKGLRTGVGLRAIHHDEILTQRPHVGWLEVHSENYFALGGSPSRVLAKVREHYPVSLHGVGLSLGSTDALDHAHLSHIGRLVRGLDPMRVSEHLSWSSVGGRFTNDLMPLPYTDEALQHMSARVRQVQDFLGRQILIENVSSYLQFSCSQMPEWEFLTLLAHEAGCGLLLDVNNVYVSAMNHGFDPYVYLRHIPRLAVGEIHLAGHSRRKVDGREILIDTHDAPVCDEVWALYEAALERFGSVPTLIEWDAHIPALDVLAAEARKADTIRERQHARAA